MGKCFPNWWAQRKGMEVSKHCKEVVRVPVPHGKACDQSPALKKCSDCSHYYDPRPGYGNTNFGKCVWVPAEGKCISNYWVRRKHMKISTKCPIEPTPTPNLAEVSRVPVPHGKACDDLTKCGDCKHYSDERGECVWVPAQGKCFANSWAQQAGLVVSYQCR